MSSEIATQKNNLPATSKDSGSQETTRQLTPAESWLVVTENLVAARISQYKELGHPDADSPDFMRSQLEAVEFLRTRFDEGDPTAIQFLEDMETETVEASGGNSEANYFLAHMTQLDFLAGMVQPPQDS